MSEKALIVMAFWEVRHLFRQKMNEKPFQIDDPTTPAVSLRTYRPPT